MRVESKVGEGADGRRRAALYPPARGDIVVSHFALQTPTGRAEQPSPDKEHELPFWRLLADT